MGLILWQEELDCKENLPPASSSSLKVRFCTASVSVAIKVPTRVPGSEFSFTLLEERTMETGASLTSNTLIENNFVICEIARKACFTILFDLTTL